MAYTKLGRVRPVFTGTWSASLPYSALEMVQSSDAKLSYIAVKDVPAGTPLTNSAYWAVVLDVSEVLEAAENAANVVNNITDVKANALTAAFDANPAVIYPDANSILKPVSVLSPVQAGEGDPSPSNIRPITGWTGAKLTRCGKNLFPAGMLSSTAADNIYTQDKPFDLAAGAYTLSFKTASAISTNMTLSMYSGSDKVKEITIVSGNTQTGFTLETSVDSLVWYVREAVALTEIQIEPGSIVTEYEPYTGSTFALDFGQTVYGGRVDWNKGLVTVDAAFKAFDGTETCAAAAVLGDFTRCQFNLGLAAGDTTASPAAVFSHGLGLASYSSDTAHAYVDAAVWLFLPSADVADAASARAYLAAQYAAGTPVQVAYRLATPTTIQLTPQLISALSGLNTVYGDGGTLEGNYNKSIAQALAESGNGGSDVVIDPTLTQSGQAADAKATGDRLDQLNEEIAALDSGMVNVPLFFLQGAYNASGTTNEHENAIKTSFSVTDKTEKITLKKRNSESIWLLIGHNEAIDASSGWTVIKGVTPVENVGVSNYYSDDIVSAQGYCYYRLSERRIANGSLVALNPGESSMVLYQESYTAKKINDNSAQLIISEAVGAMANVAESHFFEAYKPGNNLVYQAKHNTGLFYESPFYAVTESEDDSEYEGLPVTNCSQFMSTLLKGVLFSNSRYISGADGENTCADWAFFSDGTGIYPVLEYDSMSASGYAQYANERGWLYKMDISRCNIHPGDFVFMLSDGDETDLNNIGHTAFVLHVGRTNKKIKVIEGFGVTKADGGVAGIREHVYDFSAVDYYAHFPVPDGSHKAKKICEITDVTSAADSRTTNVLIPSKDINMIHDPGMYTVIIDGEFDDAAPPYISYRIASTETYISNDTVRNGTKYITTIYLPHDVDILNINSNKGYACDVTKVAIYAGYAREIF